MSGFIYIDPAKCLAGLFSWAVLLLTTLASATAFGMSVNEAFSAYQQLGGQRALAAGTLVGGRLIYGISGNHASIQEAKESALKKCNESAATVALHVPCKIISENGKWLDADPSANDEVKPDSPLDKSGRARERTSSTGSGAYVSEDGLVLTAEHVVRGAASIEIIDINGVRIPARLKAASRRLDLALLSTSGRPKSFLTVRFVQPIAGTKVFTVGYPAPGVLGQSPKVSEGIINSASGLLDDAGFMQISIPIQPGNSGGPVISESGALVGVISSTAAVSYFFDKTGALPQNINWAVHATLALPLIGREGLKAIPKSRDSAIGDALAASVLVVAKP